MSLDRLLMRSIYSIFLLCMESNTLEKLTNNFVALRFFAQTHSRPIVKIWDLDRFFPKAVLVLSKYFLKQLISNNSV